MPPSRYGFPRWFDLEGASDAFSIDLPGVLDRTELSIQADGKSVFIIGESYYFNEKMVDLGFELAPIHHGITRRVEAFIHAFFVSEFPNLQGRGIATQCLRQCIPYLYKIGVRTITVPWAILAGKLIWPKFGFRVHPDIAFQYIDLLKTMHADRTGEAIPTAEIETGPGFLEADAGHADLAKIALETMDIVMYELDLTSPEAIKLLNKRGIFLT